MYTYILYEIYKSLHVCSCLCDCGFAFSFRTYKNTSAEMLNTEGKLRPTRNGSNNNMVFFTKTSCPR